MEPEYNIQTGDCIYVLTKEQYRQFLQGVIEGTVDYYEILIPECADCPVYGHVTHIDDMDPEWAKEELKYLD